MAKENKFLYSPSVKWALRNIFGLAYEINSLTNYAVFVEFSGHVNLFQIHIAKSKEDYSTPASNRKELYLVDFDGQPADAPLEEIQANLQAILDQELKRDEQPLRI